MTYIHSYERDDAMKRNFRCTTCMGETARLASFLISLLWLLTSGALASEIDTKQVTFEGAKSEHKWTLKDLNPELPSDWSSYNYLVMEFRVSSPQRFFLWLYNADGGRRLVIQPFGQNVWMRASMPLAYFKGRDSKGFDLASANNRPEKSFFMNIWGPFGKLNAIETIGVIMEEPVGNPTLEIRSVKFAKDDPGSEFLEKLPVIDEFGQWIAAEWPKKIKDLEQLKKEWSEEEKKLVSGEFNYCNYGGYKDKKAKATGFFRVEQIDGKWWFVDPDGHLFFSTGVNCVGNASDTQNGRPREILRRLAARRPDLRQVRQPQGLPESRGASFYSWNLLRRLGSNGKKNGSIIPSDAWMPGD